MALPLLGAAAISAGGSVIGNLVGGLFNSHSQRKANAANLAIARETNRANERLLDKQNQFNLDMWNAYNKYNLPSEQRKRFEDAGINPYFALSNIDAGNAQSLMSASANPAQSATMQPVDYSYIGNSISQGASTFAQMSQSAVAAEDAKLKSVQLAYQPALYALSMKKLSAEIENTFGDTSLKRLTANVMKAGMNDTLDMLHQQAIGAQLDNNLKSLEITRSSLEYDIRRFYHFNIQPEEARKLSKEIDLIVSQKLATDTSRQLTQKEIDYYSVEVGIQMMNANANLISARAAQTNANASLMNARTNAAVGASQVSLNNANVNKTNAETGNIKADTWSKRQQFDFFVKAAKDRLQILNNQAVTGHTDMIWRPFQNLTHTLVPIGGMTGF